ncbi:RNA-directed DNA polymerase [Methylobacterium terricola]|uniref:RNA-directed DNA polymerase n=1 Tax=Methylobacterium terricola TaxID=2583531 RepID=A0A5C4LH69_9HYPH|nr:retron Ec67 family RNA-directed DNA polymerase/endonuclease [Methylobacterium terricola]TNC12723.1 RNA-directed DNA polymerase [Methylobacterium terricola]
MSIVNKLKGAKTLDELADLLGFTPSGFSYILYRLPNAIKYKSFSIPKRGGGARTIEAPDDRLKLLQRRLANVLYLYLDEIEKSGKEHTPVAHGFARSLSIITNAACHKRRRYVLNLDLAEFFPAINFGRVRGVFLKDKRFEFAPKIATLIAQIACHNHALPQGSPCSPVISNIVARLLDVRLVRLAKQHKCTYSRYADDITFSTNQKEFPVDLALPDPSGKGPWVVGPALTAEITGTGFVINASKTRMQIRGSRQLATGLLVNEKVNVCPEYYRTVRSMCARLFSTGEYFAMVPAMMAGGKVGDPDVRTSFKTFPLIEGRLGFIYLVRDGLDRRDGVEKKKSPTATRVLYHHLLFYKHFVAGARPLVITEGKTDRVYLRAAIEKLTSFHPRLGKIESGAFSSSIRFMNFSRIVHDVLQLGGGTGDLKFFMLHYADTLRKFKHAPLKAPIIVLIDNDLGTKDIFGVMREKTVHKTISTQTTAPFYRVHANLYLVKTPETGKDKGMTCIEDLFEPCVLATKIDGLVFDPDKKHKEPGKYGKAVFAEKVVRPNKSAIVFDGFDPLLQRICDVIDDYATHPGHI